MDLKIIKAQLGYIALTPQFKVGGGKFTGDNVLFLKGVDSPSA